MRRVRRIHMVGVGGSGMSGIAEVLVNLGYDGQRLGSAREQCHAPPGGALGCVSTIGHRAEAVEAVRTWS
jgi:UDP-N-acetylmuramate--alanine ligase